MQFYKNLWNIRILKKNLYENISKLRPTDSFLPLKLIVRPAHWFEFDMPLYKGSFCYDVTFLVWITKRAGNYINFAQHTFFLLLFGMMRFKLVFQLQFRFLIVHGLLVCSFTSTSETGSNVCLKMCNVNYVW